MAVHSAIFASFFSQTNRKVHFTACIKVMVTYLNVGLFLSSIYIIFLSSLKAA